MGRLRAFDGVTLVASPRGRSSAALHLDQEHAVTFAMGAGRCSAVIPLDEFENITDSDRK